MHIYTHEAIFFERWGNWKDLDLNAWNNATKSQHAELNIVKAKLFHVYFNHLSWKEQRRAFVVCQELKRALSVLQQLPLRAACLSLIFTHHSSCT